MDMDMENKLTLGSAVPAQGTQINHIELKLLIKTIESIDKRLENIEKLLLEIHQLPAKADGIETSENPEKTSC